MHVRPERVYVWPAGDVTREPQLFDAHMEEVRSGHDEEPEGPPPAAEGGSPAWDARMDELGELYPEAVLSLVAPDGFPFSVRVPISVDRSARRVRIQGGAIGVPVQPGLACLTAHDHHPEFRWQRNFQVRGDLVEEDGDWVLVPHRMVGGLELPPVSKPRSSTRATPARSVACGARQKKRDANSALEERATGDRGLRGCAASLTSSWLRSLRLTSASLRRSRT